MSRVRIIAIIAWVAAIAIGTRYIFGPMQAFGDQQYLEYITPYLALSSLIQLGLIVVFAKEARKWITPRKLAIVLLFGVSGIANSAAPLLSLWWFCVLLILVWSTLTLSTVLKNERAKKVFLISLIALGTIESVFAILQFTLQHNLGLSLLGEPIANAQTLGVAKVILHGERFLRPFGTFPHANVLGAFLLASTLALLSQKEKLFTNYPLLFHLFLGIHILADLFTYSRSTWISLAIILMFFSLKWGLRTTLPSIAIGLIALTLFGSATLGRFNLSLQEQQIEIRSIGIKSVITLITERPLGVGLREFIPWFKTHQPDMPVFYYQPPHNSVLLLVAEWGIFAGILLTVGFLWWLRRNRGAITLLVAVTVIVLSLFDHYLVTLSQGIGLLSLFLLLPTVLRRSQTT